MQLLISTTSMTPIYEQIVDQIRALIKGESSRQGSRWIRFALSLVPAESPH